MGVKAINRVAVLLVLLLFGVACSDDPVQNIDFNETQWEVIHVTAKRSDWQWEESEGRYRVIFNLPEMTKFIYEDGLQLGYVFIGEQGKDEVQKVLPFVHTYYEEDSEGNPILYTETISCDFMYGNPSTVAFYTQASDLFRNDDILGNYNFRIVLIW